MKAEEYPWQPVRDAEQAHPRDRRCERSQTCRGRALTAVVREQGVVDAQEPEHLSAPASKQTSNGWRRGHLVSRQNGDFQGNADVVAKGLQGQTIGRLWVRAGCAFLNAAAAKEARRRPPRALEMLEIVVDNARQRGRPGQQRPISEAKEEG